MPVDSNKECRGVPGTRSRRKTCKTQVAKDGVCMKEIEHLKGRLEQTPEVRAVKVTWAKVLLSDPSYPQDAALSRVAEVLSKNFETARGE